MQILDTELLTLVIPAMLLAASHALSPDHWFPFVVIGRANMWRTASVLGLALLAGAAHVATSISVGLLSVFAEKGAPAEVAALLQEIAPLLLIGFGLLYAGISMAKLRASRHGHSHGFGWINRALGVDPHDYEMRVSESGEATVCAEDHRHEQSHCDCPSLPGQHLSTRAAWGLVVILGITPCIALVPLTFAALGHGTGAVVIVNGVFAVTALLSIGTATFFALRGLRLIRLGFFDKYGGVTAGVVIALLGVAGLFLGHAHHHH